MFQGIKHKIWVSKGVIFIISKKGIRIFGVVAVALNFKLSHPSRKVLFNFKDSGRTRKVLCVMVIRGGVWGNLNDFLAIYFPTFKIRVETFSK